MCLYTNERAYYDRNKCLILFSRRWCCAFLAIRNDVGELFSQTSGVIECRCIQCKCVLEGFLHSPSQQQLICVGGWPQSSPSAASGIALGDDDISVEDELLDQGWTLSYVRCTKRAFECAMDRCRERKSTRGGCGQPMKKKKRLRNWPKSSSVDRMDGGDLVGCHIISMANISIWFGSRKEYMAPEPSTPEERPQKIGTGIITISVISCFAHWGWELGWDETGLAVVEYCRVNIDTDR